MSHVDGSDDGVGYGVFGESNSGGLGVKGHSQISTGVAGSSQDGFGVNGSSQSSHGVAGNSQDGFGVFGMSSNSAGLYGENFNNNDYAPS